ncbi:MAG: tetratricopeptide repeat protein [Isosphaeraceae bacterium]
MARTRRRPKVVESSDENQRSLRELTVFLEDRPSFRLGLAIYDVPGTREAWLDRLAAALTDRPVSLLRLDLSHEPNEVLLLRRLEDALHTTNLPEGKTPAVMVTGLEAAIDFRPMPGTLFVEGGQLLRNANLQRDAFTERCPVPVVLWLNSAGATALAQTAPDLMQWCTGIFQFDSGELAHSNLERGLLSSPLSETDRLPHQEKRERIGLLQNLLLELEKISSDDRGSLARKAALHYELGQVFLALSEALAAKQHFEESLSLAQRIGEQKMEEASLDGLGTVEAALGNLDQAVNFHERALKLAEQIGDHNGVSMFLGHLGIAHARRGDLDQALDYLRRELEDFSQFRDRRAQGRTLNNIGVILMQQNKYQEARGFIEKALDLARESKDRSAISADLNNLGWICQLSGEPIRAFQYYEEALDLARKLGVRARECRILNNLGALQAQLGQTDQAIEMLERAGRIAREIQEPELIESAKRNLRLARELEPKGFEAARS